MDDYSIKDLEHDFYLGNYQTCITKASSMPACRESIYYLCVSLIQVRKFDNARRELSRVSVDYLDEEGGQDFGTTFVDVIKAYLQDLTNDCKDKEPVDTVDQLNSEGKLEPDDELSRLTASAIYARYKLYAKALQVIDGFESLRASYSRFIVYIMMDRRDLATKEVNRMKNKDEMNPITELAFAQDLLENRNPDQAWRIALSLADRYRPTPLLNNLLTAAAMCQGDYEEARQFCESVLDMDNDNPEALINMVHILTKLRKPKQVRERHFERLKDLYPSHPFVKELETIEGFAREIMSS